MLPALRRDSSTENWALRRDSIRSKAVLGWTGIAQTVKRFVMRLYGYQGTVVTMEYQVPCKGQGVGQGVGQGGTEKPLIKVWP